MTYGKSFVDDSTGEWYFPKSSKYFHNKNSDQLYALIYQLSDKLIELYISKSDDFVQLQIGEDKNTMRHANVTN